MKNHLKASFAIFLSAAIVASTPSVQARGSEENFEGIKAGVQAGWERREADEDLLPAPNTSRLKDKANGVSYGGFIGYDAQFDKFVLGVEADFSPNGKTLRSSVVNNGTIELDSKWSASASARAGVALAPRILAYGRIGYSVNRYTVRGFAAGSDTPVATSKATGDGLLYGGGLEYAVNRNFSIGAKYRHLDNDNSLEASQILGRMSIRF